MRESIAELLLSHGGEVVAFGDELALFSAVARRRPAAILLDVVLSWVDGLRLCAELKSHPVTRDTRVIVMSGLNRPHLRERALRAGAEAFIAKPIVPEQLLRILDPSTPQEWPDEEIARWRQAL
jgi:CheY-like chemotaxis protein